jgi:hypothetical protein
MKNGFFSAPRPVNEPVLDYKKNSPERKEVLETYTTLYNSNIDVPSLHRQQKNSNQDPCKNGTATRPQAYTWQF